MSKLRILVFLSVVISVNLMALETVNLIKNHSFEKDDSSWQCYTGTLEPMENDSAEANSRDSDAAFTGSYSASSYTSSPPGDPTPPGLMLDSAVVIQGFSYPKPLGDIDSLFWSMKVIPPQGGFNLESSITISLLFNLDAPDSIWCIHNYHNPEFDPWGNNSYRKVINFELTQDTIWLSYARPMNDYWVGTRGLSPELILDSFALTGYGVNQEGWHGQKVFWDVIRLMGYADYDVGVKEILSGEVVDPDYTYTPVARIKNFGREDADTFLVIAELRDEVGSIFYADTITHSLPSDTEDTVTFAKSDVLPSNSTLAIRTEMTPDESDADDELSKEIFTNAVEEKLETDELIISVSSIDSPLQVVYSLPHGEYGTLTLYDVSGQRVEQRDVRGTGSISFGSTPPSGVFFIRLESKQGVVTRKAVVLK